jgi:crotonobetainyl-CoA:carnitine CoA-transferase CaiB-like acyl-CoA transferase
MDAAAIEAKLQALGIPAHRINDARSCRHDPQLVARRHFLELPHAQHGRSFVESSGMIFSRTPAHTLWAGPTVGEHTELVLKDFLKYSDEKFIELVLSGILE